MSYDPDNYPSRNFAEGHQRLISTLLRQLAELEKRSHPDGGEASAQGKDMCAFTALETAGQLVRALAGWAIDHQVGLALQGLQFVPRGPVSDLPEYLQARAIVDSHQHEHTGGKHRINEFDPLVARRLLMNLLRANPGGFPHNLANQSVRALEDLSFGDPAPMFQPASTDRKANLAEMRLQLRAIAFVEYMVEQGSKKYAAQEKVAAAIGVSPETLRTWEHRLRTDPAFGTLAVARQVRFAKNVASHPPGSVSRQKEYGEAALRDLAKQYRQAIRK